MISEAVVRELQIAHGWSREFVDKLTPYYVATLSNMNEGRTTPVYQVIDEIWHAHILCTRDYAEFCARTFGRFIHHERTESPPQIDGDFFPAHGLSVDGLASICAEHIPNQGLIFAACGQDNPPTVAATGPEAHGIAKCGSPTPPRIFSLVGMARCGEPDQPDPPRYPPGS